MLFYPEHADQWYTIGTAIDAAERVFITTHVNPDGDAIGSEIALGAFLVARGKSVRIVNTSKTPDIYHFLDPDGMIETIDQGVKHIADAPGPNDLVIFLDMGIITRTGTSGPILLEGGPNTVMIDHHVPEGPPSVDIAVVDPEAESTGSLVYDFIRATDMSHISHRIAEAVLTALVTDTGYFTYSNTTARTLRIAASLYEFGVSARDLRRRLETVQPLNRQRLLGLCLTEAQVSSCGRIGWSRITTGMFEATGTSREHTDSIINEIRIIKGISVAMLMIQEGPATWKISLRSMSGIPVNNIAANMGGGGHEKAAGATVYGTFSEAIAQVLDTITRALDTAENVQ